jgi:hypothetical protein
MAEMENDIKPTDKSLLKTRLILPCPDNFQPVSARLQGKRTMNNPVDNVKPQPSSDKSAHIEFDILPSLPLVRSPSIHLNVGQRLRNRA